MSGLQLQPQCPENSIIYNKTLCACIPGFVFNATTKICSIFTLSSTSEWVLNSGVDYSVTFPETIFSFDQLKKFTQSQAVILEITTILLVSWLLFCGLSRFGKLGDGRSIWFQIRWWISRLDVCFSTRHWLEDQKEVRKRKTELGGTFSIASSILFIGLFAALLYQIIFKRTVEIHNIRATNAPDLKSFVNDLEFNITTISSMSCSQLRGLDTLVFGTPGLIDYRVASLSTFANYSCLNTSRGPTITLRCNNCPLTRDNAYISWQFIDIPNEPATAVGFQFNLTARNRAGKKHVSVVSGTVKNGTGLDDIVPVTFRGMDTNVLKFNLFPRIYRNLHDLKLVQPLFHEFLPGSFINDAKELQASLQGSNNGLINTTMFINFLSDYIVEIDKQSIFGPASFLANLGGLYCFSTGIFFWFLVQCENRIQRLRTEDQVLRNVRRRRKAQDRWDKVLINYLSLSFSQDYVSILVFRLHSNELLAVFTHTQLRKYVTYTWCRHSFVEEDYINGDVCCICVMTDPYQKKESIKKRVQRESSSRVISFQKNDNSHKKIPTKSVSSVVKSVHKDNISAPPTLFELNGGLTVDMSDIQRNLENLYECNVILREKLMSTQSMLRALTIKRP